MSKVGEVVRTSLDGAKSDLIANYKAMGLKAFGTFEEALEVNVQDSDTKIKGVLKGAAHSEYMEFGRRPNKRKDRKMIAFIYVKLLEWMKVKGITDINPWMAARKIVFEGIKVPNKYNSGGVISKVINDDYLNKLQSQIADAQNQTFMQAVSVEFKQIRQEI